MKQINTVTYCFRYIKFSSFRDITSTNFPFAHSMSHSFSFFRWTIDLRNGIFSVLIILFPVRYIFVNLNWTNRLDACLFKVNIQKETKKNYIIIQYENGEPN